jgi:protein-tyrosine phosphatase
VTPKLYWVPNSSPGRLAISARPRGGDWLEDEVRGWRKQGIDVVVSLLTPSEVEELALKDEARLSKVEGIRFFSFPIEDRSVPSSPAKVEELAGRLGADLQHGQNVAIHCRQGIGRSSLISAALLISKGMEIEQALRSISHSRGLTVPETVEQREWLDHFAKTHGSAILARGFR